MRILGNIISKLATNHAKKINAICQYDPRLQSGLSKKIREFSNLFSSTQVAGMNFSPEIEMIENAIFDGFGLGLFDDIMNVLKYGYQAIKIGKLKINEFLSEYLDVLFANINLRSTMDLRKGPVSSREVEAAMKNVFLRK